MVHTLGKVPDIIRASCSELTSSLLRENKRTVAFGIIDERVAAEWPNVYRALKESLRRVRVIDVGGHWPDEVERLGPETRTVERIVAIGGGAVIDAGKLLTKGDGGSLPGTTKTLGKGERALPLSVLPTTAGSGAEVSPAAVYASKSGRKLAIVDDRLVPDEVIVVPELLRSLPVETACPSLLDGMVHCCEILLNPVSPQIAQIWAESAAGVFVECLSEIRESARRPCLSRDSVESALAASITSGLALRFTNAGFPHALAGPASRINCPHGVLTSIALLCIARSENSPEQQERYYRIARKVADCAWSQIDAVVSSVLADCVPNKLGSDVLPDKSQIAAWSAEVVEEEQQYLKNHPHSIDERLVELCYRKMRTVLQK